MSVEKLYKNNMSMFDFMKGIAILAVVFWHTIEYWSLEKGFTWIININGFFGACWMPVFLLASAYWYKPKKIKSYAKKQLKNFLLPFWEIQVVVWGLTIVIHYLKWDYVQGAFGTIKSFFAGALVGNMVEFNIGDFRVFNVGPMWFVFTLCFTSILMNIIMNQQKIKYKFAVVMVCTVIGLLCGKLVGQVYCYSAVLAATLGFYIGYQMKKSKYLIRKWSKKDYAIIWGATVVCYFVVAICFVNGWYCNAAYMTFGLPMGILALRFGLLICKKYDNVVTSLFKKLGRYTFWILMVHTVEVLCIDWNWCKDWYVFATIPEGLKFIIVFMIRLCVVATGVVALAIIKKWYVRVKEYVVFKKARKLEIKIYRKDSACS